MATADPVKPETAAPAEPGPKQRIASIDILRGLAMIIMSIDHCRDIFHYHHPDPGDLATTTPVLFFTRWITHFCAPAFVFLSGISAYLAGTRRTHSQFSAFLIKRGLWLIVVELVFINLAVTLNPKYHVQILQVIWVIGCSMIILGLLVWRKSSLLLIGTIGLIIVLGHNIFDPQDLSLKAISETLWGKVLLSGNGFSDFWPYPGFTNHGVIIAYALLPWAGLMMLGYVFGSLYVKTYDAAKRRRILLYSGLAALAVFFVLRFFNLYGDPRPWAVQRTTTLTVISFLKITKYPASLLFTCLTVGTSLIILALVENWQNKFTSILVVYGNVPFFFYLCHWYLIRFTGIAVFFISGFNLSQAMGRRGVLQPDEFGFGLGGVYLVWICVVLALYFPCRWYGKYKRTHKQWWLSYL
ncbi:MAG TPA: heparan-alpha-glucosaminide N-acetyltransferase domain-containing protein [Mucilaginibacter sp.]|jgi:uncharacterized membrane protein|nr:heparan-alpha-glucosaminide N-acetyltransferase domain-containing protein [Mucilaginibacter sp.]